MLNKLFSASVLLPLLLASPMIVVGQYGLSLAEILIVLGGVFLLFAQHRFSVPVPRFLVAYVCLFGIGWLTALHNAANWAIPVDAGRLSFLYLVAVPLLAYLVGRYSARDIGQIVTNRLSQVIVGAVGIVAAAYPLLSTEVRQLIFYYFWADVDLPRFAALRFPGMGINVNIYSFTVFVFLLFAFDRYLKREGSFVVPLFAVVIIFAGASKLVMAMAVAGCLALWIANHVAQRKRRTVRPERRPWTISRKALYVSALAAGALWLGLRYTEELSALRYTYVLLDRLEEIGETPPGVEGPLEGRLFHWGMGLERVQLAPLLGIAMPPPELTSEASALHYATPHNEFIFFWSAYGLFGLVAHVFLLGYLLVLNIRSRSGLPWILFYLSLVGQMFFDSAFQAIRFQAMFFLIAGLNIRHLRSPAEALARTAPAIGAARA